MPTRKAEDLFQLLITARKRNDGPLTEAQWLSITTKFLDDTAPQKRKVLPVTQTGVGLTDEAWISYLETLPHLRGVDVRREIGKCQFWCSVNRREPTRRAICNWLNKAERPVAYQGQGQTSYLPKALQVFPEPPGWREEFPDCVYKDWASMPKDAQKHISQQMLKLTIQ